MPYTTKSPYKVVYKTKNLWTAWRHVRDNGFRSKSKETVDLIKEFDAEAPARIDQIHDALLKKKFDFPQSRGILQYKKSGGKRPIVISPIESRVVQRSILDLLQKTHKLKRIVNVPTSFGGIEHRGVPEAIAGIQHAINNGCKYYITSDIADFFRNIPKDLVLKTINSIYKYDAEFIKLLSNATDVELENLSNLGSDSSYFDFHEVGVAQGCCLSPLFSNILLNQFDTELNTNGIYCFRYIDDFIILGSKKSVVNEAFTRAQNILKGLKLSAYYPEDGTGKSKKGHVDSGVTLLGCKVVGSDIMPSRKNCQKLLSQIDSIFNESLDAFIDPMETVKNNQAMIDSLTHVKNVLKGWGNTYSFCNHIKTFRQLDRKLEELIDHYLASCSTVRSTYGRKTRIEDKRRILGVHLLVDTEFRELPTWPPRQKEKLMTN